MKRLTALMLMLFMLFASTVLAENADTLLNNGEYSYRILEDGTLTLREYLGGSRNVTVPAFIDDIPVTMLESTFYFKPIETVEIPEGITVIGDNTFMGCTKLESVILPSTLTTIRRAAFGNCQLLSDLEIPEGLTRLEDYAFLNCLSLTKICLYSGLEEMEESALLIVPDPNDYKKILLPDACELYVEEGSAAEEYAKAHEIPYQLLVPEDGTAEAEEKSVE